MTEKRTKTLYAETYYNAADPIAAYQTFRGLVKKLNEQAVDGPLVYEILWDTLKIGTRDESYDDSTILEPHVQTYLVWTAEVLAVY